MREDRDPGPALRAARACGVLLALLLVAPAHAQSTASEREEEPGWTFTLAPYLWVAGFDGDLTLDGQEIEGDGDSDGFPREISLSGFLAHFEARKGPWSFALSPVILNVDMDGDDTPPTDSDLEISGAIVEAFATREIAHGWRALGGLRYYGLAATAEITVGGVPQPDLDADEDWVDPIVGVRYEGSRERWSFSARADVGGFGVGSDFAWNVDVLGGYDLSDWAQVFLGYRALAFDFADGSGSDRVEYDVNLWGPIIGFSFVL